MTTRRCQLTYPLEPFAAPAWCDEAASDQHPLHSLRFRVQGKGLLLGFQKGYREIERFVTGFLVYPEKRYRILVPIGTNVPILLCSIWWACPSLRIRVSGL